MPELPEAESIVRGLRPALLNRRIRGVSVRHADVLPRGADVFSRRVGGRSVLGVRRRGKNVVLELEGDRKLVVNLGMTGKLLPDPPDAPPDAPTHPALRLEMADGGELVYDDVRRFGRLEVMDPAEWEEWSRSLGPEPLDPDFTADDLARRLGDSTRPIRSWLLDQRRVAGIGNIYANETLFRARIHPRRPAASLSAAEIEGLHRALRGLLREAIDAGGTTIRDYRDAAGEAGRFARKLKVYQREGEPCPRCGTVLRRTVFGNRSAFVCPRCQDPGEEFGGPASAGAGASSDEA